MFSDKIIFKPNRKPDGKPILYVSDINPENIIVIPNVRHLSYSTIIIFLILLFKNIKKLLLKIKFKILNKSIIKKIKKN